MRRTCSLLIVFLFLIHSPVQSAQLEHDTKRLGTLIGRSILNNSDPNLCAEACLSDPSCRSFDYVKPGAWPAISKDKPICNLYNDIPQKKSDTCCISGIKGFAVAKPFPGGDSQPEPDPQDFQSKEQRCKSYAETVKNAAQENQERKCGYSGNAWNSDTLTNFQWCMQDTNINLVSSKIKMLREQLEKCRSCESYSKSAVNQYKQYAADQCGPGGPEWSGEYDYHFNWCKNGDNEKLHAAKGKKTRQNILDRCKPLYGNFNIDSIKPHLHQTGYIDHIEITTTATSSRPWLIGDYGSNKEGSMWLRLTVSNKTNKGVEKIERDYSITGYGSQKDHIPTFMAPVPGQSMKSGQQQFKVQIGPGYPNIRLEAHKMVYHHPGGWISSEGVAQPGSFKCSFGYPDIEATLYILTPAGVKSHTEKITQFQHPWVHFNTETKNIGAWDEVPQHGSGPCP